MDAKGRIQPCQPGSPRSRKAHLTVRTVFAAAITLAIVLHGFALLAPTSDAPLQASSSSPALKSASPFQWAAIEPAHELDYHDCYEGFQCARLALPLDYQATDHDGDEVYIAVIKKPARVPVDNPHYGGALLINPGGPGGSGVAMVLIGANRLQKIVDADVAPEDAVASDRYFDVISFDPRGINHSTPIISCFPDNFQRQVWELQTEAEGILGSSDGSLRTRWRRSRAFADGCSGPNDSGNGTDFLEHVNTTPVSADMLQIVERHGQWREKEFCKLQATNVVPEHIKWQRGSEKINYWGFSYGTLLGSTFASMYPERIERMALDGVVSSEHYYNSDGRHNLQDTDKILSKFMTVCAEAGPDRCRFWREGGPQAIRAAYEKLLNDIWDDPLSVVGTRARGPEVITWSDIKRLVILAVYQPLMYWPVFADLLQDLTVGNGSVFADYKQSRHAPSCRSAACDADGPFSRECIEPDWDEAGATPAILCTDGPDGVGNFSESEFKQYWEVLQSQSQAMGDYWAETRLGCSGWRSKAKWRVVPTFPVNTSHSILWIGNTHDPVTPIRNARRMQEHFPGSTVLEQTSEGHCSFTAPSLCTSKAVRKYFQTGILPDEGTICHPDVHPFGDAPAVVQGMEAADATLLGHLMGLAKENPVVFP